MNQAIYHLDGDVPKYDYLITDIMEKWHADIFYSTCTKVVRRIYPHANRLQIDSMTGYSLYYPEGLGINSGGLIVLNRVFINPHTIQAEDVIFGVICDSKRCTLFVNDGKDDLITGLLLKDMTYPPKRLCVDQRIYSFLETICDDIGEYVDILVAARKY
jgi:hypothetical protein